MDFSKPNDITTVMPGSLFFLNLKCVDVKLIKNSTGAFYYDDTATLDQVSDICDFKTSLDQVAVIVTLLLGIPGNLLSLLTIRTLPLSSGTFYVALLSLADFCTLSVHGAFYMLERFTMLSVDVCKANFGLWAFTSSYAQWALVLIILERFFTVCHPLKKSNYFTIKRCYVSAFCLGVVMLSLSAFYYWSTSFDGDKCSVDMDYQELHAYWSYVNLAVYIVLPLPLVFILTVAIASELRKIKQSGKSLTTETESSFQTEAEILDQFKIEYGITLMVSFYAVFFIILTIPVCILVIQYQLASHADPVATAKILVSHSISLSLKLFLHASNFIVYFLSSSRFRQQLMVLLRCKSAPTADGSKQSLKTTEEVPMYTSSR